MTRTTGAHAFVRGAHAFVRGDTDEYYHIGQLIAWRVDGEVYAMVGDRDPWMCAGALNYVLKNMPGGSDKRFRASRIGGGTITYDHKPIGSNEVIHVQQQEDKT